MTENADPYRRFYLAAPPLLAVFALLLWKNQALSAGIREGLILAGHTVLPALFPFSVLSSYAVAIFSPSSGRRRLLPPATVPFCIGLLCGFPLGAKTACDGVRLGLWSQREAEKMLCFCNNTGVAFLIAGVGGTLRGNVNEGLLLFCVQAFVALLTGLLVTLCHRKEAEPVPPFLPSFVLPRFTDALRDAVSAGLTVTGYIVFFSGILTVIRTFLSVRLFPFVAAIMEVGTACHALAEGDGGLPLTSLAVIFSGLSVHLQTASFAAESKINIFPAVFCKAVGGIVGAMLTQLILHITT